MSRERKGLAVGIVSGTAALGLAFGVAALVRPGAASAPSRPFEGSHGTETLSSGIRERTGASQLNSAKGALAATGQRSGAGASSEAALLEAGTRLYRFNCASCHGANGEGGFGPDLRMHADHSFKELASTILNGVPGQMPAFRSKLKDQDVRAVVSYIHSLKKKQ